MNDVMKLCGNCGHEHRYGIVQHSQDGVPLYGARACWCHCDRFFEQMQLDTNALTLTTDQTKALWYETSDLSPQASAATRMAVAKMRKLGDGKRGFQQLTAQWPEFMGFVISQITDMRAAMVRDESKFSHLVAHTDEIVEAMRGVAQLKERLDSIYETQERILEVLSKREEKGVSEQEAAHMFASKSKPLWNEPIMTDVDDVTDR